MKKKEGNKFREVRLLKRVTQEDLERRAGISQSRISLIENGYVDPRDEEKKMLARILRVRVGDIWIRPLKHNTYLTANGERKKG